MSAVVYLQLCGFCLERFPLPLGAWDGLRYFIVALPEPSYNYLGSFSWLSAITTANNQLNVCTTSVTEGEVARVKHV